MQFLACVIKYWSFYSVKHITIYSVEHSCWGGGGGGGIRADWSTDVGIVQCQLETWREGIQIVSKLILTLLI